MTQQMMKRKPAGGKSGQIGVTPTQAQKLIYIANKLGLPGIAGMQGTTFNIFDTLILATNTAPQILDFFVNAGNKSQNFSNFQAGNLLAGEALLLEEISLFLVKLSGTDLTSDNTTITDIVSIGELSKTYTDGLITLPGGLKTAQLTINIANQTVVKNVSMFELNPSFNPRTGGISNAFVSTAALPGVNLGSFGQNKIPLEASPVLPPNLKLKVSIRLNPVGTITGSVGIMCVLGRFGSIFASKTTL